MTENQIAIADIIIKCAETESRTLAYYELHIPQDLRDPVGLIDVINSLVNDNILERDPKRPEVATTITAFGVNLRINNKSYAHILEEKEKKRLKEERDEKIKDLQAQDLVTKLNTINPEQLDFWRQQKARNQQLTLIAIIGIVFSIIALLKSFGYLGDKPYLWKFLVHTYLFTSKTNGLGNYKMAAVGDNPQRTLCPAHPPMQKRRRVFYFKVPLAFTFQKGNHN